MSYMLSKLLPLLLLPPGLILALLLLGFLSRWRWPVFAAFLLLWLLSLGLVSNVIWRYLEAPWQRQLAQDAPVADVIVVLSGGLHSSPGPSRVTEWADPDRFLAGLDLYLAGKAQRLMFTGGSNPYRPGELLEGRFYLSEAQRLGIPAAVMDTTPAVVNTAEEALAIRQLLPARTRILLVTSAYHMLRAQTLFERQGLTVHPFPVDFQSQGAWAGPLWRDPTHWFPSARALEGNSRALRELLGRLVYRVK